jgi:hypothetical protein
MKRLEFTGLTATLSEGELKLLIHRHMERRMGRLFDRSVRLRFEVGFMISKDHLVEGAKVRLMREVDEDERLEDGGEAD